MGSKYSVHRSDYEFWEKLMHPDPRDSNDERIVLSLESTEEDDRKLANKAPKFLLDRIEAQVAVLENAHVVKERIERARILLSQSDSMQNNPQAHKRAKMHADSLARRLSIAISKF